jgi:signal transduction histidine kinase
VDDHKQITLDASKKITSDQEHLRITVSNSISPLPDAELEKLWNSFYKIDKARTRENGGYGLGLSIIKAIQESDGNDFGVYQEAGFIYFWVDFDIQ